MGLIDLPMEIDWLEVSKKTNRMVNANTFGRMEIITKGHFQMV